MRSVSACGSSLLLLLAADWIEVLHRSALPKVTNYYFRGWSRGMLLFLVMDVCQRLYATIPVKAICNLDLDNIALTECLCSPNQPHSARWANVHILSCPLNIYPYMYGMVLLACLSPTRSSWIVEDTSRFGDTKLKLSSRRCRSAMIWEGAGGIQRGLIWFHLHCQV